LKLLHCYIKCPRPLFPRWKKEVQADRVGAEEAALRPVLDGDPFHPARTALLVTLEKAEARPSLSRTDPYAGADKSRTVVFPFDEQSGLTLA
jgi:hypothetical protein